MIVRPSRENYRDYLASCLDDKAKLFGTAWIHHIESMEGHSHNLSQMGNQATFYIKDIYAKVLGFEHWYHMIECLNGSESPWDDERFAYIDMDHELISHLDSHFLDYIQIQRIRLYDILEVEPKHPSRFFSIYHGDHGPVEMAILLLYQIPSDVLRSHVNSLFVLDGRWPMIGSPIEPRRHILLRVADDADFSISDILESCQVPGAIFCPRELFTPQVAQRFRNSDLSLADTQRNLSVRSSWSPRGIIHYLMSIMNQQHSADTQQKVLNQFIYSMVYWLIYTSKNGHVSTHFNDLGKSVNLYNYHIDNIPAGRNSFDVNALFLAAAPSTFLRGDDIDSFKQLAKKLVYGAHISGDEFATYDRLFNKAVQLSRSVRGMLLTTLSEHAPILDEDTLNPHSQTIVYDHADVISAARWFERHLHTDGMKHIVEEMEYLPFGSSLITRIIKETPMDEVDIESLQYLMESCDKRNIQMLIVCDDSVDIPGVTEYFEFHEVMKDSRDNLICKKIS